MENGDHLGDGDAGTSQSQLARLAFVFTVLAIIATLTIRKHISHPLYKFPGPKLASISNIYHSYFFAGGRQPFKVLELHEKYGPVVRTAPNELSFNSASSWRDIYGFRQGHRPFVKSPFYDGGAFADQGTHSIVSERDPAAHGAMRKYLSHAFSDKSLKDQEELVNEVIDAFVKQVGVYGAQDGGADIVTWYNLATFDIIGSLAFGESFNGVKSGGFHFWIQLVFKAMSKATLADAFARFPLFAKIFQMMMPKAIETLVKDTKKHEGHTLELIRKRLQNPTARPDFLTRMLEDETVELSEVQIAAHASDFVIAGSETTATTLSCITYYLLRYPEIHKKVAEEIRTTFATYEDINATAASKLKYLHAVVLEGLRIYAPLPLGLPRVVPEGGDTVDDHFLPGGTIVSTNPVAASLAEQNFDKPLEFRPERWLEDNKVDNLEAAQPFSLGPRGCLGRNLAWIELSLILSKLFWSYDIKLLDDKLDWHRDSQMSILWKKPEMRISVTPSAR